MGGKKWSEDDLQFLRDNYENMTFSSIAEELGRTKESVQLKGNRIGCNYKKIKTLEIGQKYGTLTIQSLYKRKDRYVAICLCDCGQECTKSCADVLSGKDGCKSCLLTRNRTGKGITHGLSDHPLFGVWARMTKKCNDPKYHRHTEGTSIFKEWYNFKSFYDWAINNGWDKGLVFERKDRDKDFTPDNCEFVTYSIKGKKYMDRVRATNNKNIGCDYPSQNKALQQKQRDTMMSRYGRTNPRSTGKQERGLQNYLSELGLDFKSTYKILDGKEIDLYNEDLKLGFEYCGIYWHNEMSKSPRGRNYHNDKYKLALKKGVKLITIFSDEWLDRQEQVKGRIKSLCGQNETTIYARKCSVEKLDTKEAQIFFNEYHIQDQKRRGKVCYGLKYEDELVAGISLNRHHRDSSKIVVDRLCFKNGHNVVGGSGRLIKRCVSWAKQEGYKNIITWSDNRWSNGKVYDSIGFDFDKDLPPDYSYVKIANPKERIPKQMMTKKKLECKDNQTEKERATELGFARIWDCGKKRWLLRL